MKTKEKDKRAEIMELIEKMMGYKKKKREKNVDVETAKEVNGELKSGCKKIASELADILKNKIPKISPDFAVTYEKELDYLRIRDMLVQRVAKVNRSIGRYKLEKKKYDLLNEHKEEIYNYYKAKKDSAKESRSTYNIDTLFLDDYDDILRILNLEKDPKLRASIKKLLRDMAPEEEKEKRRTDKDISKFVEPEKPSEKLKDILADPEYLDTGYKWKTDSELLGELGIEILSILAEATFDALETHKTDELEILLQFAIAHRCTSNTHSKEYIREETSSVTQGESYDKLLNKYIKALNELNTF